MTTATRRLRVACATLALVALLSAALLATLSPASWYSHHSTPTTAYEQSSCHRASARGDSGASHKLCPVPGQAERCCSLALQWGRQATCADNGLSCFGYNRGVRLVLIAMAWLVWAVTLCVTGCCVARTRRSSLRRQLPVARSPCPVDSVYVVLEDTGEHTTMQPGSPQNVLSSFVG